MATDTELNTFLGVKQYAAYRSDGGAGAGRTGREKRLWELRKALKGRTWGEEQDPKTGKAKWKPEGSNGTKVEGAGKGKKRKGKKERTREKAAEGGGEAGGAGGEEEGSERKRRKVD